MLRLLTLILIFTSVGAFAQQKYFFKTYVPTINNNGNSIEKFNDHYFIYGSALTDSLYFDSFIYKIDAWGELVEVKIDTIGFPHDKIQITVLSNEKLFAVGGNFTNEPTTQTNFCIVYDENLSVQDSVMMESASIHDLLLIDEELWVIAGHMNSPEDTDLKPILSFFDPIALEETAFYSFDAWEGNANMFDATLSGNYIYGVVGSDCQPFNDCDPYLAKFDFDGNLVENISIANGSFNYTNPNVLETLTNGNMLAFMTLSNGTGSPDTGYMVFSNTGEEVKEELYFLEDELVNNFIELDNGDWLLSTFKYIAEDNYELDIGLVKTDSSGNVKWHRTFGEDRDDYVYDMLVEEDGSIVITGRYDSTIPEIGAVSTYLLKTNCMGLLTEPEAAFGFQSCGLITEFENQSLYVYPDSIDGGYYTWDFGDGATSDETNPTHSYTDEGIYQVSLTGIVCQDSSTVSFPVYVALDTCYTFVDVPIINGKAINLYPNPTSAYLNISIEGQFQENLFLEIYGINTALLYEKEINSNNESVSIDRFASGLYTYIIYSRKGILKRGKLVVK